MKLNEIEHFSKVSFNCCLIRAAAIILFISIMLSAFPLLASTEIFYLRVNGSSKNPKTWSGAFSIHAFNNPSNWSDLRALDNKIGPGDEVHVYDDDGVFQEQLILNSSGTEINPIVIRAGAGEKPVFKVSEKYSARIIDCEYIDLRGIEFQGGQEAGILINRSKNISVREVKCLNNKRGVWITESGPNIRLIDSEFTNNFWQNIYIYGGSGIRIQNCNASDSSTNAGLMVWGSKEKHILNTNIWVSESNFTGNNTNGIQVGFTDKCYIAQNTVMLNGWNGITIEGDKRQVNISIITNIIKNNSRDEQHPRTAGIWYLNAAFGRIERNDISGSCYGIICGGKLSKYTRDNIVAVNLIYNCSLNRASLGLYLYNCINNYFYNNTISHCGQMGNCGGIRISTNSRNNRLYNNVIFSCSGAELKANGKNNLLDFNNWYDVNSDNFLIQWNNVNSRSLARYRRRSGQGYNSISKDPMFVNAATKNFRLRNNSPNIGVGKKVAITLDNDGNAIDQEMPFDLGAYFFHQMITPKIPKGSNLRIIRE